MDRSSIDVDFALAESFDSHMAERTRWLRENEPIFWSEKTGNYIITRFEDVVHVSKHNEIFCSGEGVLPGRINAKIGMIANITHGCSACSIRKSNGSVRLHRLRISSTRV